MKNNLKKAHMRLNRFHIYEGKLSLCINVNLKEIHKRVGRIHFGSMFLTYL